MIRLTTALLRPQGRPQSSGFSASPLQHFQAADVFTPSVRFGVPVRFGMNDQQRLDSRLLTAVIHGNVESAELALQQGGRIDTQLSFHGNVGHTSQSSLLNDSLGGGYLPGSDGITNHGQLTPVMIACTQGNKAMLTMLLKYKPDLSLESQRGDTALMLAIHNDDDIREGSYTHLNAQTDPTTYDIDFPTELYSAKGTPTLIQNRAEYIQFCADNSPSALGLNRLASLLIHAGADVDQNDSHALHKAIYAKNKKAIDILLAHKANIEGQTITRHSRIEPDHNHAPIIHGIPLMLAISLRCPDLAQHFLARGANPNARSNGEYHRTPLMQAARFDDTHMIHTLVQEYGANLEDRDDTGLTALGVAVASRNVKAIKKLLSLGADPHTLVAPPKTLREISNSDTRALIETARQAPPIAKPAPSKTKKPAGDPPQISIAERQRLWEQAITLGRQELANALAAEGGIVVPNPTVKPAVPKLSDIERQHLWEQATATGNSILAKALETDDPIAKSSAPTAGTSQTDAPKSSASPSSLKKRQRLLVQAIREGNMAQFKKQLAGGVDVSARDDQGRTPLMDAIQCRQVEMAQLLWQHGASIHDKSHDGLPMWDFNTEDYTAWGIAIENILNQGSYRILSEGPIAMSVPIGGLLAPGRQEIGDGSINGQFLDALHDRNADRALMLAKKADPNCQDELHRTALMKAIQAGMTDVAKILINRGAEINVQDSFQGDSPLSLAVTWSQPELVDLMLDKGAMTWFKLSTGSTALMKAAEYGSILMVESLLKHQANVAIQDIAGMSALDIAVNRYLAKSKRVNRGDYGSDDPADYFKIIQLLVAGGAMLNQQDGDDETSLLKKAVQADDDVLAELLLKNGADPSPYRSLKENRVQHWLETRDRLSREMSRLLDHYIKNARPLVL